MRNHAIVSACNTAFDFFTGFFLLAVAANRLIFLTALPFKKYQTRTFRTWLTFWLSLTSYNND